jgi:hypothetical protein
MFAPKVAKTQTKAVADLANGLARERLNPASHGHIRVEQALLLQRAIGNQATLQLLENRGAAGRDHYAARAPQNNGATRLQSLDIPPTLRIGAANDPLEFEADRRRTGNQAVARLLRESTMRIEAPRDGREEPAGSQAAAQQIALGTNPSRVLQRKCACGGTISAPTAECEECKRGNHAPQAKLRVSAPDDIYEQEADRVAEQVLAKSGRPAVESAPPRIQRLSGLNSPTNTAPAGVEHILSGPGQPLEPSLRQDIEPRFGYDLSRVRVHLGAAAAQSARDVNAFAYTVGHDIVFGEGQYAPHTPAGRRLLAHEITHTIQQSGGDNAANAVRTTASRASPGGQTSAVIQRREMGSGLDDPLYSANRRWSSGQGPDDRVTGQRLLNWAIARGSFVVRNDITLMRMQERDGIEFKIVDEIYWLLISLLRGEGPYDIANVYFPEAGPSYEGLIGDPTPLDKFEGSQNAREMAVLELTDHWGPIAYFLTRALETRYRDSYLEAAGRTPEGMSLEDDPKVISRIRHNPYDHTQTINQGLGNVTFRVGQRYGPFYIADIYKTLGSGSTSGGTTWVYRDGHPLWYYSASVDRLDRLAVIGEVARGTAEAAKLAAMLLPLAIKLAGFVLTFSPNPFLMIAGVVLEEFGEEGLRDLNGEGRQFKDVAGEAAREILLNLVFAKLMGGGGEGAEASEAAGALERVAEKAAIKIRASVEKEIVRTEGPEVAKAVEAGEAHGVTDTQLIDEGFEYEVEIKHEGGAHTYRRTKSGEWCRWSSRRLCGLDGIEEEVRPHGGATEQPVHGEAHEPAPEGATEQKVHGEVHEPAPEGAAAADRELAIKGKLGKLEEDQRILEARRHSVRKELQAETTRNQHLKPGIAQKFKPIQEFLDSSKRMAELKAELDAAEKQVVEHARQIKQAEGELALTTKPWRRVEPVGLNEAETNFRVGLLGELETTAKLQEQGWEPIGNTFEPSEILSPKHFDDAVKRYRGRTGIDGVYRRVRNGKTEYLVAESKATLNPQAELATGKGSLSATDAGDQLSKSWIRGNLHKTGLSPAEVTEIESALAEDKVRLVYSQTRGKETNLFSVVSKTDMEATIVGSFDPSL